jgi:predicted O-methyltransferase YrrM
MSSFFIIGLELVILAAIIYVGRKTIWAVRLAGSASRTSESISVITTRQMEYLDSLYLKLGWPRGTLPPTRSYAGSPDFLNILYDQVKEHRPTTILDCGSGLSTVVMARCLQQLGGGMVVSLDHDPHYAAKTRAMLDELGLSDHVRVIDAPLREQTAGSRKGLWYGLDQNSLPETLDLIVVDGPPMPLAGDEGRYAAGPVAIPRLSPNGMVILDDTGRPGEQAVLKRWAEEFPDLKAQNMWAEKGCVLLSRSTTS